MKKTNYTKQIVDDYCVLDVETTGLSAYYDEVIEVGILRVRGNRIVDRYSQLIQPHGLISPFITSLTGISNEMVAGKPFLLDVKDAILSFLGNDIILGHNTHFDLWFLREGFQQALDNQYMDTVQFSRKVYPEIRPHSLDVLAASLGLRAVGHRAFTDCITTKELYDSIKNTMFERGLAIEDLWVVNRTGHGGAPIDIKSIQATTESFDPDDYFFEKHVVFTGVLDKMKRKEAMQIVVNHGAVLDNSVTKKTNCLVLGDKYYSGVAEGEKSSKHKKAEELKLQGQDIDILDERTFYDLIEE